MFRNRVKQARLVLEQLIKRRLLDTTIVVIARCQRFPAAFKQNSGCDSTIIMASRRKARLATWETTLWSL